MISYFARRLRLIEDAELAATELRAAYGEHAERVCESLLGTKDGLIGRSRLADVRRALKWTRVPRPSGDKDHAPAA
jgi:hypothetical protein